MKEIEIFKSAYKFDNCSYGVEVKTSMGVGGVVLVLCEPENEYQILDCKKAADKAGLPIYVCGNLSNTIIKDGGFKGVILKLADNFSGIEIKNDIARVKSGTPLIKLAMEVTKKGLSGLEFAGGIPGSVGGGVRMNAGAYGGQMSDVITKVTYICGDEIISSQELDFDYRKSMFCNKDDLIILEAEFRLSAGKGDMEALRDYNRRRKEKQPLEKPNCGSVFKRPEGHFVGKLVDECGLRGARKGGAMVSDKHSGFIVNEDHATAKDVLALMEYVRGTVQEKTGVSLESEWVIIGED